MSTTTQQKPPVEIRMALVNEFQLTPAQRTFCDKYFFAKWGGFYLFENLHNGEIKKDDIYYKVRPMQPLEQLIQAPSIGLSFRRLRGAEDGYVLVDIFENTPQSKNDKDKEEE